MPDCSPELLSQFSLPPVMCEFSLSHILGNIWCLQTLFFQSHECEVVSHFGFNFHFFTIEHLFIFVGHLGFLFCEFTVRMFYLKRKKQKKQLLLFSTLGVLYIFWVLAFWLVLHVVNTFSQSMAFLFCLWSLLHREVLCAQMYPYFP